MKSKIIKFGLSAFLSLLFISVIFGSGFVVGQYSKSFVLPSFWEINQPDLETLFQPYMEAWTIVHENYIEDDIDDFVLMQESIRGMVRGLGDIHSSYMNPDEYRQFNTPLEGEYTGIGAWVDTSGDFLTITNPIPGSPAEEAGLMAGDIIIGLDSKDVTGMHPDLIYKELLGPAGSKITITVSREGEPKPLTFEVTRTLISIPSLASSLLQENIAYIQLFQFSQDTDDEFRRAYKEMSKNNPIGLILDMRGNLGGLLDTAIQIASEFISSGDILIQESEEGSQEVFSVLGDGIAYEIPLVVLVDGGSASASEIVAGAIQDHRRGILVGTTTYGKGSVQSWIPLQGDNGALRITIARWFTPNGRQINHVGLEPDFSIVITPEDIQSQFDPQLLKAIELLTDISGGAN